MKRYKRIYKEDTNYYNLRKETINKIINIIKDNKSEALSFFSKIYKYTMENHWVDFTNQDFIFYKNINFNKYKSTTNIFRGETGKKDYLINDILLYINKKQYSSWTFALNVAKNFQAGPLHNPDGVIYKAQLPKNFIDLKYIFSFLIKIISDLDNLPFDKKLKKILDNQRPFGEEEVLVFEDLKAQIIFKNVDKHDIV